MGPIHVFKKGGLAVALVAVVSVLPVDTGVSAPNAHRAGIDAVKGDAAVYIVQMAADPVVAYTGGQPGLAATRPARGKHFNPNSATVRRYQQFLDRGHSQALAAAGAASDAKFYDYNYSFNGFAAELTPWSGQPPRVATGRGCRHARSSPGSR